MDSDLVALSDLLLSKIVIPCPPFALRPNPALSAGVANEDKGRIVLVRFFVDQNGLIGLDGPGVIDGICANLWGASNLPEWSDLPE